MVALHSSLCGIAPFVEASIRRPFSGRQPRSPWPPPETAYFWSSNDFSLSKFTYAAFRAFLNEIMLIGYVRISTDDQLLDLQRDAMAKAGCERVFEDTASGAKADRIGLAALLANLRRGDTVVVWRLDRLGRSIKDLIYLVEQLEDAGVGLKSLQENIDTTSTGGRLVFHLFAALAEFERNLIRECTHARLSAARARGRLGGRKKRLDPAKRKVALKLYHERQYTVVEICRMMGIGRSTLYNYITEAERNAHQQA